MKSAVIGILLLLFTAATTPGTLRGAVVDVYDGDTLTVELTDGTRERVRLIGIDAPELRNNPYNQAHALGAPAALYLAQLVAGEAVDLVLGVKGRDRYGRLLAYVYLDGLFINLEMVRAGYAVTYTVPPDVAHAEEFRAAEREARAAGRGLWPAEIIIKKGSDNHGK